MSTTDFAPTKSRSDKGTRDAGNGVEPHWSDQIVLSGAGLISGGIERTRTNVEAALDASDALVLGTFDLIEEWSSLSAELIPRVLPMVTAQPARLLRRAYEMTSSALREGVRSM